MSKHYYAAHSYMGTHFTYDSPCWSLHVFSDKEDRDAWLREMEITKAEKITANVAKIIDRDMAKAVGTLEFERALMWNDGHLSSGDADYENMGMLT